jgi:uncharacterized protein YdaU (DUF1376 family)
MAEFPVLPLFTDAFIGDTTHLNAAQTGAYLMLLVAAWRSPNCRLPDNDKMLARMARMDGRSWTANKNTIMAFWKQDEDQNWYQGRLVDERKNVEDMRHKNAKAGRASALKRKGRHSTTVATNIKHKTNPPSPSPSPSLLHEEPKGSSPHKPPSFNPDPGQQDFLIFWEGWKPFDMDKGSKLKAKESYNRARKDTSHEAIVTGAERYTSYCRARQQRTKHVTTWLNQRGWDDDLPDSRQINGHAGHDRSAPKSKVEIAAELIRDIQENKCH